VTDSLAENLTCIDCGTVYPLTYRLECGSCRGLLELRYDMGRLRAAGPALLAGSGLWRYAPVLPIPDPAHRVTLGEGGTPLLDCPRLARELGVRRLLLKFDGANPTGTVKDRSSATAVAARRGGPPPPRCASATARRRWSARATRARPSPPTRRAPGFAR
jgi:threonine synthase